MHVLDKHRILNKAFNDIISKAKTILRINLNEFS
jgi:hypothetical protein